MTETKIRNHHHDDFIANEAQPVLMKEGNTYPEQIGQWQFVTLTGAMKMPDGSTRLVEVHFPMKCETGSLEEREYTVMVNDIPA